MVKEKVLLGARFSYLWLTNGITYQPDDYMN